MEKTSTSERMEQWAGIKFCALAEMTPTDTYKFLQHDASRKVCRSIVFSWHDRFSKGRTELADNLRSGRPTYSDADVISVRKKELSVDRRKLVEEISSSTGLSHGTTHKIISTDLDMHKVCARWVLGYWNPRKRKRGWQRHLSFYAAGRVRAFLHHIVTTNETWLSYFNPESKQASMVWKTTSSPPPKMVRVVRSTKKTMFVFFMDSRGMLLQHAVPEGQIVNKKYNQKVKLFSRTFNWT